MDSVKSEGSPGAQNMLLRQILKFLKYPNMASSRIVHTQCNVSGMLRQNLKFHKNTRTCHQIQDLFISYVTFQEFQGKCWNPWNQTFVKFNAPKGTNTKVTSAKGHFCAYPELCHAYPCPCPSQYFRIPLNNTWVQYEVPETFLGRGMGMNITAPARIYVLCMLHYLLQWYIALGSSRGGCWQGLTTSSIALSLSAPA